MKYTIKKVHGFTNEAKDYTGNNTTPWQVNHFVSGFAVMLGNKVVEVYSRKYIAKMAMDALNG